MIVQYYVTEDNKEPFAEWLNGLKNKQGQALILVRIKRLELYGHSGRSKPVGGGVYELIIDSGPGYRVYYSQVGDTIILLLCAGNKKTQDADIKKAKEYWEVYKKTHRSEKE